MTTNNLRLESGQEYSLKQLFNGKNRIVVPDLQRDYCWGDKAWNKDAKNYTELVSGFLDSLLLSFNENKAGKLTLGLIYGYENPHFTIQLCDGQQRLTTLFLLVGMLNRNTNDNHFKDVLISEAELADNREPNLQYAIRESTLYFLSDLVCEFFLKNDTSVDDITRKDWYFKEYDLDASIQSMLAAIKTIDNKLAEIKYVPFGEFIINNLQMLYYDMGHRTRGEETFVVINTTGEPLTATENLKPILIGTIKDERQRKKAAKEWEDREEWFWKNKNSGEQTSDEALKDFFIWYWQIRLIQERSWRDKKPYPLNPNELFQKRPLEEEGQEEKPDSSKWEESINLDLVHKYFTALELLVEKCKDEKIGEVLRSINDEKISLSWFRSSKVTLDVVLPLIAYITKFEIPQNLNQFVRRIRRNFFDKQFKVREKNYIDWRYIIQIINFSINEEAVLKFETKNKVDFKLIPNVLLNEWYNDDEKQKDELKKDHSGEMEQWEDHQDFTGDLSFIFDCNKTKESTFEDLQRSYTNYTNVIDSIREEKDSPITNTFRLFLLYIGCEKVEHKPRVSWEIEGVLFSTIGRNHLFNDEFKKLCHQNTNDLENYCLNFILNKINEWKLFDLNESNFTTERALKCWLTLKVFNANKENTCLSFYDGKNSEEGVSVYISANKNKLIDSEPFSINNMICGFGVKAGGGGSYISYTNNESWLKPNIIDTPFAGVNSYVDKRTSNQLNENKKIVDSIVEFIEKLNMKI